MGEIVAAAIVSHHPGLMVPKEVRLQFGDGNDSTLIEGFSTLRSALDASGADTLVIFDTHWFTTMAHLVAGADRYQGRYTSEELPQLIPDLPYDYPGNPALADEIESVAKQREIPAIAVESAQIALHYPTLNLVHWLRKDEKILSVGVNQHCGPEDYLAFGEVIGEAIRRSDAKAALLASGAFSHVFTPLGKPVPQKNFFHPDNVTHPEHRRLDERVIALLEQGDHAAVLDLYPELRKAKFEGFGGHYLQMLGAIGGRGTRAKGRAMSAYEAALGTGNIHLWFDLAPAG